SLFGGEKFLVSVSGGALQRHVTFVRPDALQIGITPRGLQRRRLRRRSRGGYRQNGAESGRGNGDRDHRACEAVTHDGLLLPYRVAVRCWRGVTAATDRTQHL